MDRVVAGYPAITDQHPREWLLRYLVATNGLDGDRVALLVGGAPLDYTIIFQPRAILGIARVCRALGAPSGSLHRHGAADHALRHWHRDGVEVQRPRVAVADLFG